LAGPCPGGEETDGVINSRSASVAPAGYRFPRDVIAVAVRWYLRYGLSYRDVEELLSERGVDVDHVTVYRWVQTFTPEFIDAARPLRHAAGDRWFVDEVRHEALWIRVGVRDLHRRAVAADRLQLGVA
jgi:transposase-like protein